jgi:hypothetical protein
VHYPLQLALRIKVTLLLVLAAGCGGTVVEGPVATLKGKITKGGQPLPVNTSMGNYAYVEVMLMPAGGGAPYIVRAEADGSFAVETADGKPPPAGKYRVAVRQWEPYPQTDRLGGKFDERNTPITIEVTDPPKDLNIDLDKPQG